MEWHKEGVNITKQIEKEGTWGDCPLPLLAQCNLTIIDWIGPSTPSSQFYCKSSDSVTYTTGFAKCSVDRMLEMVLLSMLEGEQALVTLDNPSIQVRIQLNCCNNSSTIPEWPADKCIEVAKNLKQVGVEVFKEGHFQDAFFLFSQSLRVLTLGEGIDNQLLSIISCNMSACQLQAGNYELAAELCEITLKSQPENRKALYRRGMAAFKMGDFKIAEHYASKVIKLEPSNAQAASLLTSTREALNSSNVEYQAIMHRMFN